MNKAAVGRKSKANGVVENGAAPHVPQTPDTVMPMLMADISRRQEADHAMQHHSLEAHIWGRTYALSIQGLMVGVKATTPQELVEQLSPLAGLSQQIADGAVRRYRQSRGRNFEAPPTAPAAPANETKHD